MHQSVKNLNLIKQELKLKDTKLPSIIAVSKTFQISNILPLIDSGHIHFGENKVQEAVEKWTDIKAKHNTIKLHMIGKLQTNKVKFAVQIFVYIHSVDSKKLAKKIFKFEKQEKFHKFFTGIEGLAVLLHKFSPELFYCIYRNLSRRKK